MLEFDPDDLERLTKKVNAAADKYARKISEGTAANEEDVSGQFCGALAEIINGFEIALTPPGLAYGPQRPAETELRAFALDKNQELVQLRQTKKSGNQLEERESGADIIIVYESETPGIAAQKGFLAQSKIEHLNGSSTVRITRERARFERRCETMHAVTPHSYVFVYTEEGLLCYPVQVYRALLGPGLNVKAAKKFGEIFKPFMQCLVGDTDLYHFETTGFYDYVVEKKAKGTLHISDDGAHKDLINQT